MKKLISIFLKIFGLNSEFWRILKISNNINVRAIARTLCEVNIEKPSSIKPEKKFKNLTFCNINKPANIKQNPSDSGLNPKLSD